MNEAREVVSRLKAEAAKKETVLAEKQEEANRALQLITDTMKNANDQKVQMEALKEQTLRENKKITERSVPTQGSHYMFSALFCFSNDLIGQHLCPFILFNDGA